MSAKDRLDRMIDLLEARIDALLTDIPVEDMSASEREMAAAKHLGNYLRALVLRNQLEAEERPTDDREEQLASILGFRRLRPGQSIHDEERVG